MLTGDRVVLRTRLDTDVPVLHAGLYDDIDTRLLVSARPWQPLPVSQSPFLPEPADDAERIAVFTVADPASDAPIGDAVLWGIDNHNRLGHLGMSLLPAWRGRGCAGDIVRLLCRYGFQIRGLHRLQLETLSTNTAMIRTALAAGFRQEGVLRSSAWVAGQFVDEVIFGLLVDEWNP